jgi:hypothetical protein
MFRSIKNGNPVGKQIRTKVLPENWLVLLFTREPAP